MKIIVTRIVQVVDPTIKKNDELYEIARRSTHLTFYLLKADALLQKVLTASPFDLPEIFQGLRINRSKVHGT